MFKPTYLYIKTHNITGLKYFGKTTAKDPYKYKGSGTRWLNHLNKHGNNISTEIIGYYINEEECVSIALKFSRDNDIVESNDWANLKEEYVIDGGYGFRAKDVQQLKEYSSRGGKKCRDLKLGIFSENYKHQGMPIDHMLKMSEKSFSPESREKRKLTMSVNEHQRGEKHSQYGTFWITNGKENKKLKKSDQIPNGWYKGRKM